MESWKEGRVYGVASLTDDPRREMAYCWQKLGFNVAWGGSGVWSQNTSPDTEREWILAPCLAGFVTWEVGTLLDFKSFRVAIALRVGAYICVPHSCRYGGEIDSRCWHDSCKYSAGRFDRHSVMNDLIRRALQKASLHRFWSLLG